MALSAAGPSWLRTGAYLLMIVVTRPVGSTVADGAEECVEIVKAESDR